VRNKSKQPTIHMLCGFICSGKTTLAQKLERKLKAVTFCHDEWMARLFGQEFSDERGVAYAPKVHALISRTYEKLLKLKIDIVLDDGFWRKCDRDNMRKRAVQLGAKPKLYFLDCPKDILIQRLRERDAKRKPDSVIVSEAKFKISWKYFEPPGTDEEYELVEASI
jgi:predicted kinase